VTAALIAVAVAAASLVGFLITQAIWLHSANEARLHAADIIDGQRKLVAEYKSKYDVEFVAHSVAQRELEQERQLRGVAEAQRNAAQRHVQDLLRSHIATATEDDIRALTATAFASPLAVVPAQPARRSDSAADGLIDPFAEVQPPKPAS
jgi:hypothetical protein